VSAETFTPRVLLFRGKGVISSLIRWQTRSIYSHAAILTAPDELIESWQGSGVQRRTVKQVDLADVDQFEVDGMNDTMWAVAIAFMTKELGCGYDYASIAAFVTRRNAGSPTRWFCSELVFAAIAAAGVQLFRDTQAWEVSPGMLSKSPKLLDIPF